MNGIQITVFILVALSAFPLLHWAWRRGEQQKDTFEKEGVERLQNNLRELDIAPEDYKIFLVLINDPIFFWKEHKQKELSFEQIKKIITHDVTKNGGDVTVYSKARFSFRVDKKDMHLYFVVGHEGFDFCKLKKDS